MGKNTNPRHLSCPECGVQEVMAPIPRNKKDQPTVLWCNRCLYGRKPNGTPSVAVDSEGNVVK